MDTGEIPQQMLLPIVILILKGNSRDYRSIGLLKPIWKLIEWMLDKWMSRIEVHDYLHGFWAKHGCGTGTVEAKLIQQLTFIKQSPLYGISINLRKAYDATHRERCINTLKDVGAGPKVIWLIINFWEGRPVLQSCQIRRACLQIQTRSQPE